MKRGIKMEKKKKIKRVIVIIAKGVLLIAGAVYIIFRLGGSHVGIGNNPEAPPQGNSNTLVVYFSWSGNDQKMASWIAEEKGADIFRIVPADDYGSDYQAALTGQNQNLTTEHAPNLPNILTVR